MKKEIRNPRAYKGLILFAISVRSNVVIAAQKVKSHSHAIRLILSGKYKINNDVWYSIDFIDFTKYYISR